MKSGDCRSKIKAQHDFEPTIPAVMVDAKAVWADVESGDLFVGSDLVQHQRTAAISVGCPGM
jgi:hypothetical protein